MARTRCSYDHTLRDLVQQTGDVTIATNLGVPRSTAVGFLIRVPEKIVIVDPRGKLQAEVVQLRRRVDAFRAVLRLLVALPRTLGVEFD